MHPRCNQRLDFRSYRHGCPSRDRLDSIRIQYVTNFLFCIKIGKVKMFVIVGVKLSAEQIQILVAVKKI